MNNRDYKISVLLPTYNCEKYISSALESILIQTHKNIELLILYDESNDKTYQIICSVKKRDSRVKIIHCNGTGLIGALNKGLELANGEFIARMDADDLSALDRFEIQLDHIIRTNSDICGSHFFVINSNSKKINAKIVPTDVDGINVRLGSTVPFAHGSVLIRTQFFRENFIQYGLNYKYAEDYALWVELVKKGAVFTNVDRFLYEYRELPNSLSKKVAIGNKRDNKSLNNNFIRTNFNVYITSIKNSTLKYENLTDDEKKYLLIGSFKLLKFGYYKNFYYVLKKSNIKIITIFALNLLRGI